MHAEEPEVRDLFRELAGQDALLEPFADLRHDPLAHPLTHRVPDRLLLVVEERVDREKVAGVERRRLGGRRHAGIVEEDYWAGASRVSASDSHPAAYLPQSDCPWPPG